MHWLVYFILALVLVVGLYINLVGLPGLWIMVAAALVYTMVTGWAYLGFKTLIAITIMAGIAELVEFLAGQVGAKRAGANKRGVWGAIIGGIVGAIALTGLIPVPPFGTIFGVVLGTFLGAAIGELWGGTNVGQSVRVGVGAAKGRILGMFSKLIFGCAILTTVLIVGKPYWPWHHANAAPSVVLPPAVIAPTTLPITIFPATTLPAATLPTATLPATAPTTNRVRNAEE